MKKSDLQENDFTAHVHPDRVQCGVARGEARVLVVPRVVRLPRAEREPIEGHAAGEGQLHDCPAENRREGPLSTSTRRAHRNSPYRPG